MPYIVFFFRANWLVRYKFDKRHDWGSNPRGLMQVQGQFMPNPTVE